MKKNIITFLSYIFLLLNSNLAADENDGKLRVGLLAPFSGEYKNLGESLLLSTQLALDEIDDKNIIIIPRDSGTDNKDKLNLAIKEIINNGAKIIIGPMSSSSFGELSKYRDTIFISLSNKEPKISKLKQKLLETQPTRERSKRAAAAAASEKWIEDDLNVPLQKITPKPTRTSRKREALEEINC